MPPPGATPPKLDYCSFKVVGSSESHSAATIQSFRLACCSRGRSSLPVRIMAFGTTRPQCAVTAKPCGSPCVMEYAGESSCQIYDQKPKSQPCASN